MSKSLLKSHTEPDGTVVLSRWSGRITRLDAFEALRRMGKSGELCLVIRIPEEGYPDELYGDGDRWRLVTRQQISSADEKAAYTRGYADGRIDATVEMLMRMQGGNE